MRVLGIDTATRTASVGIVEGEELLAERCQAASLRHGLSLLALVEEVLNTAGMAWGDLEGIAVSIGPGSFTGLRVGLSTAKGIAFAQGLPLVGIPTLRALALAADVREGIVSPILDARKGEVYAALFRVEEGQVDYLVEECAMALEAWLSRLPGPCTFIGDAVAMLNGNGDRLGRILPFERFFPRGSIVASLGAGALAEGRAANVATLEPLYVRPSEAEKRFS